MDIEYDLELPKIVGDIKSIPKSKTKVCLQFPDGLKAHATRVVAELQKELPNTEFVIWAGSNFGGCDYPWYIKDLGFDLLINFGHSVFKKWPDKQN